MFSPDQSPLPPPFDRLFDGRGFSADAAAGTLENPAGTRVVLAPPAFFRSLRQVLQAEKAGGWQTIARQCGTATGVKIAAGLDAEFARLGEPGLAELPLETCLTFIEHYFATHGWGLLELDLSDAPAHGIVTGRLRHSYFVEIFGDVDEFVDPLLAGILQGFFAHVSGQDLGCIEVGCARRGASHCTFAITAPERLASVTALLGSATAETIVAKLKA